MQRQQLTLDAAYKFTLWYSLFSEAQAKKASAVEQGGSDAYVREVAFSLIKASLPRKSLRTCCLSGACGRTSLTHKRVYFGRPDIYMVHGERDDVCQCLAHATASVGRPVCLLLKDYSSSASLTGDRYGGLRCMLRHMDLQSVAFSGISDFRDAEHVVEELSQILMSVVGKVERLSLGDIPAHVAITPVLRSALVTDNLTELSLEGCRIEDVEDILSYMRATARLRRLSLRRNHGIAEGMAHLGLAVAACPCLLFLDISFCRLRDDQLYQFLSHLQSFSGRTSFTLDASNNALSNTCFAHFRDAPVAFQNMLTVLDISGHNFGGCGDVACGMLLRLPALCGILLNWCEVGPRDFQRLCKVFSQKDRYWRQLSFRGNVLAAHDIKRMTLASFAAESSFCVADNNIGVGVQKLNLTLVLPLLSELDLSFCDIRDEGLLQLASALEKVGPFSLRVLRLDGNNIGVEGMKGRGGLQFLGRALRANYAPRLEVLSLAHNKLLLRPLLTLLEQVSSTLRELHISYSSVASDDSDVMDLVGRIIRRQKGFLAFEQLDVWALRTGDAEFFCGGEMAAWLEGQRAVRVIVEAK